MFDFGQKNINFTYIVYFQTIYSYKWTYNGVKITINI